MQDAGAVGLRISVVPPSELHVQIRVGKNHYFGWYVHVTENFTGIKAKKIEKKVRNRGF